MRQPCRILTIDGLAGGAGTALQVACALRERMPPGSQTGYLPLGGSLSGALRGRLLAQGIAVQDDGIASLPGIAASHLAYLSGAALAVLPDAARAALLDALSRHRAAGGIVVFDPCCDQRLWAEAKPSRRWIARGYATSDIVFASFAADAALFHDPSPEASGRRIMGLGAFEVVVKNGSGPLVMQTDARQTRIPAERPPVPLDHPAASSGFNAGWLAARLTGSSATEAVAAGRLLATRLWQDACATVDPALA